MSFADSIKGLIGLETIEDDEEFTEEELNEAKEQLREEAREQGESRGEGYSRFSKPEPAPVREPHTVSHTATIASRGGERRFTVTSTQSFKLVLLEPKTFEECPKLVDSLKSKKPVIINLERLETETARKIFDFLSGATYALNGVVQKVANNIFIFAPANVGIAGGISEEKPEVTFPVDSKSKKTESPWG